MKRIKIIFYFRTFAEFPETDFKQYLNAEASVLRKNKDR